jgi:hypothetical protein
MKKVIAQAGVVTIKTPCHVRCVVHYKDRRKRDLWAVPLGIDKGMIDPLCAPGPIRRLKNGTISQRPGLSVIPDDCFDHIRHISFTFHLGAEENKTMLIFTPTTDHGGSNHE